MTVIMRGNIIVYTFEANEAPQHNHIITLPDGYSFESIIVIAATNIGSIESYLIPAPYVNFVFPPVNSKSPCTLNIYITDITLQASVRLLITKFGQIPDTHYFDKAFTPILVTGDDGNEYNVIPSDQFK